MADKYQTTLRLQLLALGYSILPNVRKSCLVPGWNTPEFATKEHTPQRVESWARRFDDALSTGLRLEKGTGAIDVDVDHPIVDALLERVAVIAPDVAARAPTRYGGGTHKIALFVQVEGELFGRVHSRAYMVNGEKQQVEIFGGAPTKQGKCSRQFGIYGPHSEGVNYAFAEGFPALADVAPLNLPKLTRAQASAIVDAFDELARGLGWEPIVEPDTGGSTAVYDIDEDTRFDTDHAGRGLTYAELVDACDALGELRCSSSFIKGRSGTNPTRCWVKHTPRHDCVAVYVYGDEQTHYPKEKADIDPAAFAERLAAVVEMHGAEMAPGTPNWRERYENGTPRASLHNARLAIEAGGYVCSHDVFHNKMLIGRGEAASPRAALPAFCGEVTDNRIAALRWWVSRTYGRDFTEKHIRDAVVTAALERAFNPVVAMLAEAEASWDGVARLDRMAVDHFGCDDTPYARACVRKTMVAAVARARNPGCKFDTILVLESPEGWNKSTAWLVLAGGPENFSDESILGKASREAMEQLAGIWIHENAELAGLHKSDIDVVRAYASRAEDRARPAYGHFLVRQPRQSIEVGTTNSTHYLQAQNGNRRFWPILLRRPIDIGRLRAERLQLWGEAAAAQSGGENLTLPPELWPFAAIEQEARRVRDPWEPLLEAMTIRASGYISGAHPGYGIIEDAHGELRVSTADIYRNVLDMDKAGNIETRHAKRLADAMRALGWATKLFKMEGKVVRGYAKAKATKPVTGNE